MRYLVAILLLFFSLKAEHKAISDGRASWNPEHPRVLKFLPVSLGTSNQLTLVTPSEMEEYSKQISRHLRFIYTSLEQVFGDIPKLNVQVHLMPEDEYYALTGAPEWTNAIFYEGEILIPVRKTTSHESINRTIRHEFTHAVIDAMSDGKCPGWLDEGLAQWAEGEDNPALTPALLKWLGNNPPVALTELKGGFTGLAQEKVPAAYAQSLFATSAVLSTYGFESLTSYFAELKKGTSNDLAFNKSFNLSDLEFEKRLGILLNDWKASKTLEALAQ